GGDRWENRVKRARTAVLGMRAAGVVRMKTEFPLGSNSPGWAGVASSQSCLDGRGVRGDASASGDGSNAVHRQRDAIRVLVIAHDSEIRRSVAKRLAAAGCDVRATEDDLFALMSAHYDPPHVIVVAPQRGDSEMDRLLR